MTADRALDQQLGAWFDERSTTSVPDGLLKRSLARVSATRQRPGWLVTDHWRSTRATSRPGRRWLLVVATLAIGTGVVGASLVGGRLVAPNPGPTPTRNAVADSSASPASWTATGSMGTPRADHTATLLTDGKVLVAGGRGPDPGGNANGAILASAELYDPAMGTWTATGRMATPRQGHTATLLPDGKVLVAGGVSLIGQGVSALASAELYDPATGIWTATGTMVTPRQFHTATLLFSGRVLVSGGYTSGPQLASAELYDPTSGTWAATGTMVTAGDGDTATRLRDGSVLAAGGMGSFSSGSSGQTSAELYDPASGTWTATGNMVTAGSGSTVTLLPDGKVLVAGGYGSGTSAELYDPVTGSWTTTGTMIAEHWNDTATLLPDGRVLVAGTFAEGKGTVVRAEELYDPSSGTWVATRGMSTPRSFHTATLLDDGRVLVTGGGGGLFGGPLLASAELYDPGNETAAAPPAPSASGMFAYILPSSSEGVLAYVGALWVANVDGTGARRLAQGLGGSLGAPAWSSDGTRVVFSRTPFDGSYYPIGISQLYMTDASGNEPQLVDTGCVAPCSGDSDAAFSMDGNRLVFVRTITGGSVLATVDLTTGHVVELASTTVTEASGDFQSYAPANYHPRWSPDGTQIAFTQDVPNDVSGRVSEWGPLPAVFVVDADGRNLTQIGPAARTADWSPDGARIVFGSAAMPGLVTYLDIYTIRPDGTDSRRLTSDQVSQNPSWTVDGRIEFLRVPLEETREGLIGRIGPREFWIMDADGGNAAELSPPPLPGRAWPISWPPRM